MARVKNNLRRELSDAIALEHLLKRFLTRYSRPNARHEVLEPAYRYIISYRAITEQAIAGDPDAIRVRRAGRDTLGA